MNENVTLAPHNRPAGHPPAPSHPSMDAHAHFRLLPTAACLARLPASPADDVFFLSALSDFAAAAGAAFFLTSFLTGFTSAATSALGFFTGDGAA